MSVMMMKKMSLWQATEAAVEDGIHIVLVLRDSIDSICPL
jgi:hypothetical protein